MQVTQGPAQVSNSVEEVKSYMLEMLMTYMRAAMKREEGQALVEYALILALVSIASILVLTALGTSIGDKLQVVVDALAP
jgi:pilus assembly protein Flp/PilA